MDSFSQGGVCPFFTASQTLLTISPTLSSPATHWFSFHTITIIAHMGWRKLNFVLPWFFISPLSSPAPHPPAVNCRPKPCYLNSDWTLSTHGEYWNRVDDQKENMQIKAESKFRSIFFKWIRGKRSCFESKSHDFKLKRCSKTISTPETLLGHIKTD